MKKASVLIIGAGGLGCPASQYLAATGIGGIFLDIKTHFLITYRTYNYSRWRYRRDKQLTASDSAFR